MASSKPCAELGRRVAPALAASNTGVMPLDALYEILLLLPADAVCRFRAVCQPWRSLLSDQHFIAAHAARHPEPLIVAGYHADHRNDGILFDIMDLSGRVVKRVRPTWGEKEFVTSTQLDLVCTAKGNNTYNRSFRLLNPASGAVYALPQELTEEFAARGLFVRQYRATVVFGKVASTGEYKVLRLIGGFLYQNQLYEVFTLNGSRDSLLGGED